MFDEGTNIELLATWQGHLVRGKNFDAKVLCDHLPEQIILSDAGTVYVVCTISWEKH